MNATVEAEPFIPGEWQEQYEDLTITTSGNFGDDRLWGVEKETGHKVRLPWDVLEDAVQDEFGHGPIEWSDEQKEIYRKHPEIWKEHVAAGRLKVDVTFLENKAAEQQVENEALATRVDELERANAEFVRMIREKDEILADMRRRLDALEAQIEALRSGRRIAADPVPPADAEPAPAAGEPAPVPAPEPTPPAPEPAPVPPAPTPELTPAPADPPEAVAPAPEPAPQLSRGERMKHRWNNRMGWLGDRLSGRRTMAALAVRNADAGNRVIERDGEEVVVYEEPIVEDGGYTERDVHRGEIALGAIALAGIGLVAAYWLGKNGGHEHVRHFNELINQNNSLKGRVGELQGQVNHLQSLANQDNATLGHMQAQLNNDTNLLNKMSAQLSKLRHLATFRKNYLPGNEAYEQAFNVEPGSGIIREVHQYADGVGKYISDNRAYQIYQQLRSHFGRHIIDLSGTRQNTYMVGNDIRLTQPGDAHWYLAAGKLLSILVRRS
jgi:predicted nuclease with TOPRIM domain